MVKKLIGIISYLPDNQAIRSQRFLMLVNLLKDCFKFNLPIMIIAQNWAPQELDALQDKCIIKTYPKLGIVGARNELRKQFIESEFDYLIMLDDDCILKLNQTGITEYLAEIDAHPSGAGEFRNTLLKLYAISKDLLQQVDFDENISAETGVGFEDTVFVNKVRKKFKDKVYTFKCRGNNINEVSLYTKDPLSTWYTDQDLKSMLTYTHKVIDNMK
ncbi:glycosyltransferase family 2 protein [Intestinibacter sp.]|uniref:glycosyltransferase family 2 protein n=1 Tax=Intestinibacter sp. TaxID=1965304 RepID=UPI002A74D7E0|nr:hypothetical protein [Intestinibacter sp.]MDY2735093.1 hypothetical protein [Intestinibacter sp.]